MCECGGVLHRRLPLGATRMVCSWTMCMSSRVCCSDATATEYRAVKQCAACAYCGTEHNSTPQHSGCEYCRAAVHNRTSPRHLPCQQTLMVRLQQRCCTHRRATNEVSISADRRHGTRQNRAQLQPQHTAAARRTARYNEQYAYCRTCIFVVVTDSPSLFTSRMYGTAQWGTMLSSTTTRLPGNKLVQ